MQIRERCLRCLDCTAYCETSYKEGIICERNEQLEFHYMKRAAELGLLDAQHNLAVMYKEGRLVKKDDLKALAWFTQAGNFGFPMSMVFGSL